MSNVGHVEAAYQEAIRNPSRGRRKNCQATSRNESGLAGAYKRTGYGKWYSRIRVNRKTIYLKNSEGKTYFHSAEEAHQAYLEAAKKYGIITSF